MTHSPATVPTEPGGEEVHTQSALKGYIDAIHQPSLLLVGTLLDRSQIPWSLALDRLAAPVARIEDTALRLAPSRRPRRLSFSRLSFASDTTIGLRRVGWRERGHKGV